MLWVVGLAPGAGEKGVMLQGGRNGARGGEREEEQG